MLRSLNVATPATAALVDVPVSVPEPGFVPIATVTLPVKVVTGFPEASSAVTVTGAIATPATASVGSSLKINWAGGPMATSNALLVSDWSDGAVAASL